MQGVQARRQLAATALVNHARLDKICPAVQLESCTAFKPPQKTGLLESQRNMLQLLLGEPLPAGEGIMVMLPSQKVRESNSKSNENAENHRQAGCVWEIEKRSGRRRKGGESIYALPEEHKE